VARLSETGSATPQVGDWESALQVIMLNELVSLKLDIKNKVD
jgi:hypothetical protein